MRIAIFTDTYLPQINGVTISTQTLVEELEKRGHEVIVIGPQMEGARRSKKRLWRFRSITFPFQKEYQFVSPISRKLSRFKRMTFDIIHVQTPFSLGHVGQYLSWKHNIALVHTYHTFWIEYAHYLPIFSKWLPVKALKGIDNLLFSKRFCNRCEHVIAPSDQMKEKLDEYGVSVPITTISTGIQLARKVSRSVKAIRADLNISATDKVLVYVGRLGIEKNLYFLLDAFKQLIKKHSDLKLVLVGDGPERENIEEKVAQLQLLDVVTFVGYVPHEKVFEFYKASDIIAFPSKTETQGLSLVEGLAFGKPGVCINEMGVKYILKGNYGGFLTKDDLDDYCEKIDMLLSDKTLYKQKALEAKGRAQDFSVHAMIEKTLYVYEQAILTKQTTSVNKRSKSLEKFFKGEFWKKLFELEERNS